jgi:hypothetical protein
MAHGAARIFDGTTNEPMIQATRACQMLFLKSFSVQTQDKNLAAAGSLSADSH